VSSCCWSYLLSPGPSVCVWSSVVDWIGEEVVGWFRHVRQTEENSGWRMLVDENRVYFVNVEEEDTHM
jgi:hypothetical protein